EHWGWGRRPRPILTPACATVALAPKPFRSSFLTAASFYVRTVGRPAQVTRSGPALAAVDRSGRGALEASGRDEGKVFRGPSQHSSWNHRGKQWVRSLNESEAK